MKQGVKRWTWRTLRVERKLLFEDLIKDFFHWLFCQYTIRHFD